MAGRSALHEELLRLLRPFSRRLSEQVSEQVRPHLAAVGRSYAGRPAPEILPVLEQVVRDAGATPNMSALAEFAEQISAGENPFE